MAEAATTVTAIAVGVGVEARERIDFVPHHFLNALQHQLGDAIATMHVVRLGGVGVEQHHLDLATVCTVDEARRVDHADAVFEGEATSGEDKSGMAVWDGNGNSGGHQQPATRGRQDAVLARTQVESCIAGMGVGRQGEVGVESNNRDGKHPHHFMWWGSVAGSSRGLLRLRRTL